MVPRPLSRPHHLLGRLLSNGDLARTRTAASARSRSRLTRHGARDDTRCKSCDISTLRASTHALPCVPSCTGLRSGSAPTPRSSSPPALTTYARLQPHLPTLRRALEQTWYCTVPHRTSPRSDRRWPTLLRSVPCITCVSEESVGLLVALPSSLFAHSLHNRPSRRAFPLLGLRTKGHAVPEKTGTGRQSGGFSPGLGLGVPAEGRDWMGLGLVSAGRRSGLGLGLSAESRDWMGLGLTRDWTTC